MKKGRKRTGRIPVTVALVVLLAVIIAGIVLCAGKVIRNLTEKKPEELLVEYMGHLQKGEYDAMYSMIDTENSVHPEKVRFVERNSGIYEGIEAANWEISKIAAGKQNGKIVSVSYTLSLDTAAGKVQFENEADFFHGKDGYKLMWRDSLIFPELTANDRVQVVFRPAERGRILDRSGRALACKGTASSVGIVPGKIKDREASLEKIAQLLEIDRETIEAKLSASWVQEDSFVPIATISKVQETDLMALQPGEVILKEQERQTQLLEIPGVMITDVEVRTYNLGKAAAHLIGYVQEVTAEDLEEHPGEGYRSGSMIGRAGMEGLYEQELKGTDGCDIRIVDEDGNTKTILASISKEDGKDVQLTIDAELQKSLYEQFQEVRGCSVAVHPYTGEVLALVSTPSYDNNAFISGLSEEKWNSLNEDKNKPLYNRFRQIWCPGSTFKPVVAGIGLKTGALAPNEDFGNEGLSWQKDSSWGAYEVTTLQVYEPVVLRNALIYSDNIYFAKAALRIGAERFAAELRSLGFDQELPFEIAMSVSQYSNAEAIETEIQLADSGYGQGQILVNPLHLASIYTAFLNEGDMLKPYLRYKENPVGEVWIPDAFSPEQAREVLDGMIGVMNDPGGTGYGAHREDILLAGKTGTAELKANQEDTDGTEIGWLAVCTAQRNVQTPVMVVSMVEDVKDIGGSSYVVSKDKAVLDGYLK